MEFLISCPKCGEEDTLERKFDAWACYSILGISPKDELVFSDDFDTQIFDDNHIECSACGEELDEDELIDHLRQVNPDSTPQDE